MPPRPAGTRGAPLAARHVGSGLPSARRLLRSEITTLVGSADSLTRATGMERRTPKPLPTGHDEPDPTGAGAYVPGRRLVRAEPGGAGSWGPSTYLLPRAGQGGRFIGRATQDSGNARARWLAPRQAASQPRPAAVYMPPLQERPARGGSRCTWSCLPLLPARWKALPSSVPFPSVLRRRAGVWLWLHTRHTYGHGRGQDLGSRGGDAGTYLTAVVLLE